MDKRSQKLFEKREALQYLIEDSKLALIELDVKLENHRRYFTFSKDYAGIRSDVEPSLIFAYVYQELYKNHLVEMEYIRERTNLNYLISKARMLWQK